LTLLLLAAAPAWLAAKDPPAPLARIAFGSCAHQDRPQPIWESVIAMKPDLFLFIGDNIYADTADMDLMRKKYAKLAAMPGYQKLLKTCPLLATWDDHDYGRDDAGADYEKRVESQQIFLDFFGVPKDSPRRKQEGIYHAEVFGPPGKQVQVILLDTRYFRSPLKKRAKRIPDQGPYLPHTDRTTTLLGEAQWKWLEAQLRVPAQVRVIASSIQVVPEDHGWEKWQNLPHERERLLALIRQTKAAGVVFISGDRHLAELSMMDGGVGYPLYDLTSSGLNQAFKKWRPQEANRHRVATMNHGDNFGLIAIDWERKDPLIALQIRDLEGDVILQQKIRLSMLQPGAIKARLGGRARLATGELLTDEEVARHLKKKVTIEMAVTATGAAGGLVFLNSASERLSEENFTVVLDGMAQEALKKTGVDDPRQHFDGRTVRVTGVLTLFRERPQIIVSELSQIEILKI
jgi:alkaline phosphatase D